MIRQLDELRRTLRLGSVVIAPILVITGLTFAVRFPVSGPALIALWVLGAVATGVLYPLALHAPRKFIVRLTLVMAAIPAICLPGTLAIEKGTLISMAGALAMVPVAVPLFFGWSRNLRTAWVVGYALLLSIFVGLTGPGELDATNRVDVIIDIGVGSLMGWIGGALLERPRLQTIATELELRRVNRILSGHATTDPLTDLLNRRRLTTDLGLLAVSLRQSDAPCAVLMFDLDRFKRLNDELGHAGGDDALRLVGATLKQTVRGRDTVYRYGGEEFVVILPDANLQAGMRIAERIRLAIEGLCIPTRAGDAVDTLTISGGVAVSLPPHGDWDAALRVADFALYEAKAGGRNQVRSATPEAVSAGSDQTGSSNRHEWRTASMLDLHVESPGVL